MNKQTLTRLTMRNKCCWQTLLSDHCANARCYYAHLTSLPPWAKAPKHAVRICKKLKILRISILPSLACNTNTSKHIYLVMMEKMNCTEHVVHSANGIQLPRILVSSRRSQSFNPSQPTSTSSILSADTRPLSVETFVQRASSSNSS